MDYGYINARIRGMHSRLFDRKAYDALIIRQDIPSIITELEKTPYKKEIEEANILYSGITAIDTRFGRTLSIPTEKFSVLCRVNLLKSISSSS